MMINKIWVLLIMMLIGSGNVWATVEGQCSNCHTMHNSQNSTAMAVDSEGNDLGVSRSLTKGDCVGCHTGAPAASVKDGKPYIPYIMSYNGTEYGPDYSSAGVLSDATDNTLAGGTFNYVRAAGTDSYGHNVFNIRAGKDANMPDFKPPGWEASTFVPDTGSGTDEVSAVGSTWDATHQLTCAGTNGCHGNHVNPDDFGDIRGAHHGDDSVIDGSSVAKSYRFLRGILGQEDNDWELTVSESDHNIYYGIDRSTTETPGDKKTISYLCAECHGLFHGSSATDNTGIIYGGPTVTSTTAVPATNNPWLRHPTDFSLSSTGTDTEYRKYAKANATAANEDGGTKYNYIAPLASSRNTDFVNDPDGTALVISNPFTTAGDDIVTCLSCHRAHGSKYPDLLRWDYTKMQAGAGAGFANKGCFACHTSKD